MVLAVDMGNTNITIGLFNEDTLVFESRIATDKQKMSDQYAVELRNVLNLYSISPQSIEGAIISSVVPSLDQAICLAIEKICQVKPLVVGPGLKTGINIKIDNPAQLGADLLVGAVAAVKKYGTPCIIWDLGTATTLSAISDKGEYLGGAIMAGVKSSLDALIKNTSLLPNIRLDPSPFVIGTNTIHCMQSGLIYSTASMVDGMTKRVQNELGGNAKVIMTGGLGQVISPYCETEVLFDETLILDGLLIIYKKNVRG